MAPLPIVSGPPVVFKESFGGWLSRLWQAGRLTPSSEGWLVGWSLTYLFSTNTATSETKPAVKTNIPAVESSLNDS